MLVACSGLQEPCRALGVWTETAPWLSAQLLLPPGSAMPRISSLSCSLPPQLAFCTHIKQQNLCLWPCVFRDRNLPTCFSPIYRITQFSGPNLIFLACNCGFWNLEPDKATCMFIRTSFSPPTTALTSHLLSCVPGMSQSLPPVTQWAKRACLQNPLRNYMAFVSPTIALKKKNINWTKE